MSTLEHLFTDEKRRRVPRARCVVCGAPRACRIQLTVARLNSMSKPEQGKMRSVSVTVCNEHAPVVWERATSALGNTGTPEGTG
jgi:hypothetical protein